MVKNFFQSLERIIRRWVRANVETTLPGIVIDIEGYQQTQQIRVVQPLINLEYEDNEVTEMPYVYNVPVELSGTHECAFTVPIKVGDTVTLKASKRSLDELKRQATEQTYTPRSKRFFDSNDVIAFPTVLNSNTNLKPHPDHVEIKFRNILVSYQDDGTIIVTNSTATTTHYPDGRVTTVNDNGTWDMQSSGTLNYSNSSSTFEVNVSGQIQGQNSSGVFTLQPGGNMLINGCTINTSGNVITASGVDLDQFKADYDIHDHPSGSPNTGPPNPPA